MTTETYPEILITALVTATLAAIENTAGQPPERRAAMEAVVRDYVGTQLPTRRKAAVALSGIVEHTEAVPPAGAHLFSWRTADGAPSSAHTLLTSWLMAMVWDDPRMELPPATIPPRNVG